MADEGDPVVKFYKKAAKYWANIPATVNGVLGGYEHISDIDIDGSKTFLEHLFRIGKATSRKQALDCGAGIGRVSKLLLMPHFAKVDLVEQDAKFMSTAQSYIGENDHLGMLYHVPLQKYYPNKKYDLIWCQWVLGSLTDPDLVALFKRCKNALTENGIIVVKENITSEESAEYDPEDSSVTRTYNDMRLIFHEANLEVLDERIQTNFPDEIYDVYSFALVPITYDDER